MLKHVHAQHFTFASCCLKIILELTQPPPLICFSPLKWPLVFPHLHIYPQFPSCNNASAISIMVGYSNALLAFHDSEYYTSMASSHILDWHNNKFSDRKNKFAPILWILQNVLFHTYVHKYLPLQAAMFFLSWMYTVDTRYSMKHPPIMCFDHSRAGIGYTKDTTSLNMYEYFHISLSRFTTLWLNS